MPKVSVIIPTYNRATLLPRAVNSVLNQTYRDFELIIVDDGSTDNTKEVIRKYKDPRIQYIKHDKNKGGSAARNLGIKMAKGEYIAFLDSDDEWLPEKIYLQLDKLKATSSKVGAVYSGIKWIHDKNEKIVHCMIPNLRGDLYVDNLTGCFMGQTPLVKRECFDDGISYDESLQSHQDWDLWIRISKKYDLDYVEELLYIYHISGNQLSNNLESRINGWKQLLSKHREEFIKHKKILSMHFNYLAKLCCLDNARKNALIFFIKSIFYSYVQKDSYIHILLLIFAPKMQKEKIFNTLTKFDDVIFY